MTDLRSGRSTGADKPRRAGVLGLVLGARLETNALALMATTVITALFGLVFWAVAARYPAAEVGRASAVLSTAAMLSTLSTLSVGLLFTRFLGSTGSRSRTMVLAGYGMAAGGAAALSTAFVLFIPNDALFGSFVERLTFPVLAVVLAMFTLQDWVLVGLRAARWVPLEQLLFSAGKLGLLALLSLTLVAHGIVLAWAVSAAVAVLVVSPLLLLRILPNRPPPSADASALPGRRGLSVILLGEYASGATSIIVPLVLPLIIVAQLGTQANAYYALAWLISDAFNLLLWNIYTSYMTEASNDRRSERALTGRTIRMVWLVGGFGTPFLLVAAPFLLSLLGGEYSAEGTDLLRLLAIGLPFTITYSTFISMARVRQLMGRVVSLQVLSAVLTIGGAAVLVGPLGINGVGWAYLGARVITTLIVIVPLRRMLTEPVDAPSAARAEGAA